MTNYFIEKLKYWASGALFVLSIIFALSETFMPYSQLLGVFCLTLIIPILKKE